MERMNALVLIASFHSSSPRQNMYEAYCGATLSGKPCLVVGRGFEGFRGGLTPPPPLVLLLPPTRPGEARSPAAAGSS
jgi:hypothetical protein